MKNILLVICVAVMSISCGSDDGGSSIDGGPEPFDEPATAGLSYSNSTSDFTTTYSGIRATLQGNPNITVVDEVNHSANAQSVDLNLSSTRVIFFGNPALGTPIMQENQLAGLDLPQRIMVYQNSNNQVIATYNSTNYLSSRYGVQSASTLPQIDAALSGIVNENTENEVFMNSSTGVSNGQGIITLVSQNDFSTTFNNLRNAITDNPNLSLFFELDHQDNAESVGLELRPTSVLVFGNPNLGTPLMQDSQTTAIDLPQKFLIWQDAEGEVRVSYNNPSYLMDRHDISDAQSETLDNITSALNNLAIAATN